jgi:hypothetical protein
MDIAILEEWARNKAALTLLRTLYRKRGFLDKDSVESILLVADMLEDQDKELDVMALDKEV